MKKPLLLLAVVAAFVVACNSNKSESNVSDSTEAAAADATLQPVEPATAASTACFAYTKNRDTASLELKFAGEEVTGNLSYKLFEKDRNSGSIAGEIKGDTIIAEYTFASEGAQSIREVVFLKKGDQWIEGFGDVEEKKGKVTFKNRAALKFGDAITFTKTDCP